MPPAEAASMVATPNDPVKNSQYVTKQKTPKRKKENSLCVYIWFTMTDAIF
jgi:hypothetical protein